MSILLLLDNRTTFVSSLILALARFNLLLDREFLYSNFLDDSVQQFLLRPLEPAHASSYGPPDY